MIRREGSRRPVRGAWRVLRETVRTCVRHRATGLAAEGAFFAVLALPPLIFGLAGSLGFVIGAFGDAAVAAVKADLIRVARRALTADSVREVLVPTLDSVLDTGRVDIVSIGFLIALWSGSRALHVVMDGITIMYGKNGVRGVVKARLFSFWAYVVGLGFAVIVLPLVLAGPEILAFLLPETLHFLRAAYWPAIAVVSTAFLGAFFHVTQPRTPDRRPSWRSDLPGAVVVMLVWIAGSQLLRVFLAHAIGAS
ncbi:MAG TPA: YhjD/YihY/BrkB family envelope integrity protein, partial [Actinopolymorphaceae bacterium]